MCNFVLISTEGVTVTFVYEIESETWDKVTHSKVLIEVHAELSGARS